MITPTMHITPIIMKFGSCRNIGMDARDLSELDQTKVGQISDDHTHMLGVPNFIGFINAYIRVEIWGP